MPFYIRVIAPEDYGMVVNVYAIIAILLVVVTFGFETGYFRFVTDENKNKLLDSYLSFVTLLGIGILLLFHWFGDFFGPIFEISTAKGHYLELLAAIVLVDAINAIFFAELRYARKSLVYSFLRLIQVVITISFTIYFLLFMKEKTLVDVDYILLGNLLGSLSSWVYFIPKMLKRSHGVDISLLKTSFAYCFPLVLMGVFGMLNQQVEKLMLLKLDTTGNPYAELAVYGANYKIGILMAIFTQSFRLAFEPFFFRESKESDKREIYADVMKYFVYFGLLIYAGVVLFIPFVNIFLTEDYYRGNVIIPIILLAQLMFGVYYSLSMWYKKIDKTWWGIIMSASGLTVNIIANYFLIPTHGILGAALSSMMGYCVMMLMSLALGHKYYPIPYQYGRMLAMSAFVIVVVGITKYINEEFFGNLWFILSIISIIGIVFVTLAVEKINIKKMIWRK